MHMHYRVIGERSEPPSGLSGAGYLYVYLFGTVNRPIGYRNVST